MASGDRRRGRAVRLLQVGINCCVIAHVTVANIARFNVKYAEETYGEQPVHNSPGVWK